MTGNFLTMLGMPRSVVIAHSPYVPLTLQACASSPTSVITAAPTRWRCSPRTSRCLSTGVSRRRYRGGRWRRLSVWRGGGCAGSCGGGGGATSVGAPSRSPPPSACTRRCGAAPSTSTATWRWPTATAWRCATHSRTSSRRSCGGTSRSRWRSSARWRGARGGTRRGRISPTHSTPRESTTHMRYATHPQDSPHPRASPQPTTKTTDYIREKIIKFKSRYPGITLKMNTPSSLVSWYFERLIPIPCGASISFDFAPSPRCRRVPVPTRCWGWARWRPRRRWRLPTGGWWRSGTLTSTGATTPPPPSTASCRSSRRTRYCRRSRRDARDATVSHAAATPRRSTGSCTTRSRWSIAVCTTSVVVAGVAA